MLRISLPDTADQQIFSEYGVPQPLSGTDVEVNGDVILLFEDEQEAVHYLDTLEEFGSNLETDAPAKQVINLIVGTIANDEFVKPYLQ